MNPPGQNSCNFYLSPNAVHNGFCMTFANGYTVSVRWGSFNYSKHDDPSDTTCAVTAEVAAWDQDGKWFHAPGFDYDGENVLPHLSPDKVLQFMNSVAAVCPGLKEEV